MRAWRVELDPFTDGAEERSFLNKLMDKGIPNLRHFKLYFDQVFTRGNFELVNEWKDHVYGIEICQHQPVFPYLLKNLEILFLWGAAMGAGGQSVVDVHSSTLKRLIIGTTSFLVEGGQANSVRALPKLEALYIYYKASENLYTSMFNLGRNITVLRLTCLGDLTGMNPTDLKLPNLKQLRIEGANKFKIVIANADQLEMLSLQLPSYLELEDYEETDHYPEHLPKTQMLFVEYSNDENIKVLTKLLSATAKSLKHLVLLCTYDKKRYKNRYVSPQSRRLNMEKLTSFTHDHVSKLTDSLIKNSSDTLEMLTVDMEDSSHKTPEIPVNLPKLKTVVFTYTKDQFLINQGGYMNQVKESHPQADVRGEKIEAYMSYANAYMEKLGADEMLRFTGEDE